MASGFLGIIFANLERNRHFNQRCELRFQLAQFLGPTQEVIREISLNLINRY